MTCSARNAVSVNATGIRRTRGVRRGRDRPMVKRPRPRMLLPLPGTRRLRMLRLRSHRMSLVTKVVDRSEASLF